LVLSIERSDDMENKSSHYFIILSIGKTSKGSNLLIMFVSLENLSI